MPSKALAEKVGRVKDYEHCHCPLCDSFRERDRLRDQLDAQARDLEALQAAVGVKVATIAQLQRELEAARAQLQKYGQHLDDCNYYMGYHAPGKCDCGYLDALAQGKS